MKIQKNIFAVILFTLVFLGSAGSQLGPITFVGSAYGQTFQTIFEHIGSTDPATEGWTGSPNPLAQPDGPLAPDAGFGVNAWFTDDNSTALGSGINYSGVPSDAQIAQASVQGWKLSWRLRVVDIPDHVDASVFASYNIANTRRYNAVHGTDASGNPTVRLWDGTGTVTTGLGDGSSFGGPSFTASGSGYHLYELVFDPVAGSADLFVDGVEVISNYTGHTFQADIAGNSVTWGGAQSNTTGQGNYNLVRFEIGSPPVCTTPPSGMVSWWDGDAVSGTTALDIQGANHGTLLNGATTTPGKVGQAFSFDGVNDYIEVADSPTSGLDGMTNITLDAWIKPNNVSGAPGRAIVNKYNTTVNPFKISYGFSIQGGELRLGLFSSSNNTTDRIIADTVGAGLVAGQWYHVAATYDGVSVQIYVNGVSQPLNTSLSHGVFTSVADTSEPVRIGSALSATFGLSAFFDGLIDEVEIFNRALSAVEIQAIYNAGSAGKCKTPADFSTIFEHIGSTDPVSEGWTGSPNPLAQPYGPLTPDAGFGINAWFTDDNSIALGSYINYSGVPADVQIAQASALGWKLSWRLRVVDILDHVDASVSAEYSSGISRYSAVFGSDASGNPIVRLWDGTGTVTTGLGDGSSFGGPSYTVSGNGYHLYELVFDPVAGSADLLVDGVEVISNYTGHTFQANIAGKRVIWGSNHSFATGHGNWNLVRWEIGSLTDVTPPTGTISIDGGSALTNTANVTLTLSCDDGTGSGCDQMQFSNDGVTFSAPQSLAATTSWTLATGDGAKTVYARFIDVAGNVSTIEISDAITLDTTPPAAPVISSPADGAASQNLALVISGTAEPNALINVLDGAAPIGLVSADGAGNWSLSLNLTEGAHSYTASATDEAGNVGPATAAVNYTVDSTAPSFPNGTPANITGVEATSAAGAVVNFTTPLVTDAGDAAPTVVCSPASGSIFAIGDTLVTCTATDASNNSASVSFTVNVVDTTAPTLGFVAAIADTEATSSAGAVVTFALPGVSDIVDANPTVTCTPASGSTFALGTTTVTCSAVDASGNATSGAGNVSTTVTVIDTTAPVLTVPANVEVDANGYPNSTVDIGTATATDFFPVTITSDALVDGYPIGDTTVTWTATDASGNSSTATQIVTMDAKLSSATLKKAEVEWREMTDESGVKFGMTEIKAKGSLVLPPWMPLSVITADADVSIGLAGIADLMNQSVAFTVKGDKWQYKMKTAIGLKELEIKWKGAEFEFKDAASGVKLETEGDDLASTSLSVDVEGHEVMLLVNGQTLSVSLAGIVTSPYAYDQDEDGEVTFELPFELTAATIIQLTIDGVVQDIAVGDHYTPAQGKFELKAEVNAGSLNGASRPTTLDIGLSLGSVAVDGTASVSNWSKLSNKEWKLKH